MNKDEFRTKSQELAGFCTLTLVAENTYEMCDNDDHYIGLVQVSDNPNKPWLTLDRYIVPDDFDTLKQFDKTMLALRNLRHVIGIIGHVTIDPDVVDQVEFTISVTITEKPEYIDIFFEQFNLLGSLK